MRLPALFAALVVTALPAAAADAPSFDCGRAEAGSIEAQVCGSKELSALDRQMTSVYAAARAKAKNEHPPTLAAEQRGWIKGRNDCWKASDQTTCVRDAYRLRIGELQARYQLVPGRGPIVYVCNGQPSNEVVATFFATDPPSALVERGDRTSIMFLQPDASGALQFGPLAGTRAMCPPGSLAPRLMRDLPFVRSYLLRDGQLHLSLMADGGILSWAPAPR